MMNQGIMGIARYQRGGDVNATGGAGPELTPDQITNIKNYARQAADQFNSGVSPETLQRNYLRELNLFPSNARAEAERIFANEINTYFPGTFSQFKQYMAGSGAENQNTDSSGVTLDVTGRTDTGGSATLDDSTGGVTVGGSPPSGVIIGGGDTAGTGDTGRTDTGNATGGLSSMEQGLVEIAQRTGKYGGGYPDGYGGLPIESIHRINAALGNPGSRSYLQTKDQRYLQTLPSDLRDDYRAYIRLGSDISREDAANMLRGRGLSSSEINQVIPTYNQTSGYSIFAPGGSANGGSATLDDSTDGVTIGGSLPGGSLTLDDSTGGVSVNTGTTDGVTLDVTGRTDTGGGLASLQSQLDALQSNYDSLLSQYEELRALLDLDTEETDGRTTSGTGFGETSDYTGVSITPYSSVPFSTTPGRFPGPGGISGPGGEMRPTIQQTPYTQLPQLQGGPSLGGVISYLRPFGTSGTPEDLFLSDPSSPASNVGSMPPPVYFPFAYQSG